MVAQLSTRSSTLALLTCLLLDLLQAAQGGHYHVAKVLVSSLPALINTRDKRELLPAEIVKNSNTQWTKLLTEQLAKAST